MQKTSGKPGGKHAPARINKNAHHSTTWPFIKRTFPRQLWDIAFQEWQKGPKAQLAVLYRHILDKREDGRPLSITSQANTRQIIFQVFADLKEEGYAIHNVLSLRSKHVVVLGERWKRDNLAAGTIADRLSKLRRFCDAIGKGGLIPRMENLAAIGLAPEDAARTSNARFDKSWTDEDIARLFDAATKRDYRLALVLKIQHAFGLRAKEAYLFKPHIDHIDMHIYVERGTKGGRPREIPVDTDHKREVLADCQRAITGPTDSLAGMHRRLKQAKNWYHNGLTALGVSSFGLFGRTGHGLRHGFVQRELEARGAPVAVKVPAGMPIETSLTRDELKVARLEVAELVGHSRISVTGAYTGTLRVALAQSCSGQ